MKKATHSSETSVLTSATWRDIPEDDILHSHHCENLKSYFVEGVMFFFFFFFLLLLGCKWVANPVAALVQYSTKNNIHKQIHITTTNDM
jgi:hypothetical protein